MTWFALPQQVLSNSLALFCPAGLKYTCEPRFAVGSQPPPNARFKSLERRHESFGHIAASKRTEASMHIRSSTHPAIEPRSCRAFISCAFHVVLVEGLGRLRCALP